MNGIVTQPLCSRRSLLESTVMVVTSERGPNPIKETLF